MGKKKHSQQLDLAPSKTAPNAGSPGRVSPASPSEGAICGIYGIYCVADERWYVGQSVDIRSRIGAHFGRLRRGVHSNKFLQRAFSRYGESVFLVVLLHAASRHQLDRMERRYISYLGALAPEGFNFDSGGNSKKRASRVTRARLSAAHLGHRHTRETREKMSQTRRGRPHSEEHRRRLAAAIRSRVLSEEAREKMGAAKRGKPVSTETRRKQSISQKLRFA